MKKILLAVSVLGAAVGAIGLAACNEAAPPNSTDSSSVEPEARTAEKTAAVVRPVEAEAVVDPKAIALAETLADVLRGDDAFAKARKLGELLPTLGLEAAPAIRMTLEDPKLDFGAADIQLLVTTWATHQPEEASTWAALESPLVYRGVATLASFALWAREDPQAVLAAITEWGMQPGEVREAMQLGLIRGWFARDPSELAKYIKSIGMGIERQRVVSAYVRLMIQQQGIDAVKRWAESLPGDEPIYKTTVFRQVGAALPLFDHDAAIRWCEAHCDGPYGNNLRSIIARRWVRNDGAAAMEWLSTAPDGHEKDLSLRATFAVWGQVDREAAMAWMAAQTAEEVPAWLKTIVPVYTRLIAQDSFPDAIEWAERIESDEERELMLIRVARAWRKADEAAAEAWLLQSPLSEEAREKVRAPAPERQPGRGGPAQPPEAGPS